MVLSLTFKCLIHFEFIFVCGIRKWSSFIILQVSVQFSQNNLFKTVFTSLYVLVSFSNIN